MTNRTYIYIGTLAATAALAFGTTALADVERRKGGGGDIVTVVNDAWQPEDFVNGTAVPATWHEAPLMMIDGLEAEVEWETAKEVEVPLQYGAVDKAWVKAIYTDDEVFIRVKWADDSENRDHRPWVWNADKNLYEEGPQVEDSVMLSFEAGCEWTPSLLGGYMYDFDAWHWMAARSDPLGQAVDLYGNVQDQAMKIPGFEGYDSRITEDDWILKFTENQDVNLHAGWEQLDRVYMLLPATDKLWVKAVPDGGHQAPPFVEQLPAPNGEPDDPAAFVPQFSPVKLTGGAAEVAAKGRWEDGFWVVEFRRVRHTPAEHIFDTIFNRTVQFSVQVFDGVDRFDEASESGRLFLQFLPAEQRVVSN